MDSDEQNRNKVDLKKLKTRPFERNIALTKLGLGAGTKIVAHSVANIFRGRIERNEADREFYRRQAQVLADELGRLKGSVMKAGQMLSLYGQYFLPEEAVAVLAQLQDDTPPVHWSVVAPVLQKSLGRDRMRQLEVDESPLAAASLGQVHRARRKSDGRELCVKIQYPGVAAAIESDIRTLSRLMMMSRLIPEGLDPQPVFNEVRDMLYREVDYVNERHYTEEFARLLADDPRYVVPEVIGEFSSDQVLTTTYERGVGFRSAEVQALPQARRDRLGRAMFDLFLTEFFGWGMVQTDPHFGNYKLRLSPDGEDRIVLLDFGATRSYSRDFVCHYGRLVRGAVNHDRAAILQGARGIGLMRDEFPAAVHEAFADMCERIIEPFDEPGRGQPPARLLNERGEYRWGESDLPMRVAQTAARNVVSTYFRVPPREIVFLHRRLGGVFVALGTLRAELSLRAPLLGALSSLLDEPPAAGAAPPHAQRSR